MAGHTHTHDPLHTTTSILLHNFAVMEVERRRTFSDLPRPQQTTILALIDELEDPSHDRFCGIFRMGGIVCDCGAADVRAMTERDQMTGRDVT